MDYKKKDEELFGLVQQMIDGDFSVFERVYELSVKYIYKIINDVVKDHHATEDLMQDTYIAIYNNISGLQNNRGFYSWAGRIATNNALNYLRKNNRITLVGNDEDGESQDFIFERASEDQEENIPENIVMNEESQKIIAGILDNLPVEQKISVQYFYFEEMSVQEVADAMGCSTGTVKSRLNYARKTIKAAIEELDKKYGTKLYAMGVTPVITTAFHASVDGLVLAGTVIAVGFAGVASGLGLSAGAGAGTAVGAAGVSGAVVAKVAAIIAAVAVAATGTVLVVNTMKKDKKPAKKETTETTQAEAVATKETDADPIVEPTEETIVEPVELSYFDEMGFSEYYSLDVTLPCHHAFNLYDKDGNFVESVDEYGNFSFRDPMDAKYTIMSVNKSLPNSIGNVTITIDYRIEYSNAVQLTNSDDIFTELNQTPYWGTSYSLFSVFDYYTGTCLNCSSGRGGEFEFNGETIKVIVDQTYTYSSDVGDWSYNADFTAVTAKFSGSLNYTLTIICPEDYDGAVLCIDQGGTSCSSTGDGSGESEKVNHIFNMGDRTASDYYAYRLKNYF